MALSIKHPEADRLARELARSTGEGLTEAVIKALRERLAREKGRKRGHRLSEELRAIGEHAFRTFGKGRRAAGLNCGDCLSYALAQSSGEPPLFKGGDFT
jgi:antitoxin VapB